MALALKMPALSPTMEQGTLAKWLVREGDGVRPGDLLAEIETDKATMEFEAVDEGVIASLIVPEGTADVAVGTVLALIALPGESVEPKVMEAAAPANASAAASSIPASVDRSEPQPREPMPDATAASDDGDVAATPLARRIATIKGLSLLGITGTGARGRIIKADLHLPCAAEPTQAPAASGKTAARPPAAPQPPPEGVPVETVKLSTMRRTIARRLAESKQTVPHFYLTARCNLDPLLKLRHDLNTSLASRDIKLSVNDLLIKAMAQALTDVPDANVQYGGDELHRFSRVDISMAVAVDGGLITPVIRDVASLSLSAIAQQSKALATRARDGSLIPEDYHGGTASISNLGMFGIDEMFPVLNPPQAVILGVGAGIEQPWKVDGAIALATILACTASFDHRAIDGATAAQFMAAMKDYIEGPLLLLG